MSQIFTYAHPQPRATYLFNINTTRVGAQARKGQNAIELDAAFVYLGNKIDDPTFHPTLQRDARFFSRRYALSRGDVCGDAQNGAELWLRAN
ncbi:MAG: hypothetical protein LDLANPLL_00027 [Turneriella sp.]|nr:hypothetical protein [Turneriella sp.]